MIEEEIKIKELREIYFTSLRRLDLYLKYEVVDEKRLNYYLEKCNKRYQDWNESLIKYDGEKSVSK